MPPIRPKEAASAKWARGPWIQEVEQEYEALCREAEDLLSCLCSVLDRASHLRERSQLLLEAGELEDAQWLESLTLLLRVEGPVSRMVSPMAQDLERGIRGVRASLPAFVAGIRSGFSLEPYPPEAV